MSDFVPTPYPRFQLEWPLAWILVGGFILVVAPFTAVIYFLITVPISAFFCLRYLIDLAGAWLDHKWGLQAYLNDRRSEMESQAPCDIHALAAEDPACPYLHPDQIVPPV